MTNIADHDEAQASSLSAVDRKSPMVSVLRASTNTRCSH